MVVVLGDDSNRVEITPLGAGQEVGRSCIIVKYLYVLKLAFTSGYPYLSRSPKAEHLREIFSMPVKRLSWSFKLQKPALSMPSLEAREDFFQKT